MDPERGKKSLLWSTGIAWLVLSGLLWIPRSPYFRPWEVLREGPVAFRPLTELEMAGCGDLGRSSHVEELQYWCRTRFTTDELGFRNREGSSWARTVVVGDSFVVGSGVDDAETIPARLALHLGEPVTNYGCVAGLGPLAYLADPRSRESPPEIVVWAPAFRTVAPVPLGLAPFELSCESRECASPRSAKPEELAKLEKLASWWTAWAGLGDGVMAWKARLEEHSTLTHLSRRAFHESYWRLAEKPWEIRAIEIEDAPALVLTLEAQGLCAGPEARRMRETVMTIDRLRSEVTGRGSRFVFAPIPDVGTIYPDAYSSRERSQLAEPAFIDLVFRELAARGVACVDLRPALRESRYPYLYLRDDTHLSPRGTEVVARALAAGLRAVLASRR